LEDTRPFLAFLGFYRDRPCTVQRERVAAIYGWNTLIALALILAIFVILVVLLRK